MYLRERKNTKKIISYNEIKELLTCIVYTYTNIMSEQILSVLNMMGNKRNVPFLLEVFLVDSR